MSPKEYQAAYYQRNRAKKLAYQRQYAENNREVVNASIRVCKRAEYWSNIDEQRQRGRDKHARFGEAYCEKARKRYQSDPLVRAKAKERAIAWRRENRGWYNAKAAKRRAQKLSATPAWLTDEQKLKIRAVYESCPKGFHVDHIIPLQGRSVCGLHVPWNLQHLPAVENIRKGNR